MLEMQCVVSGKVQGVSFRDYVVGAAEELRLVGYVQNQSDNTVLVVAQGESDKLKELVEYLHEGPLLASVEGVSVEWRTVRVPYDDFSLLH